MEQARREAKAVAISVRVETKFAREEVEHTYVYAWNSWVRRYMRLDNGTWSMI